METSQQKNEQEPERGVGMCFVARGNDTPKTGPAGIVLRN